MKTATRTRDRRNLAVSAILSRLAIRLLATNPQSRPMPLKAPPPTADQLATRRRILHRLPTPAPQTVVRLAGDGNWTKVYKLHDEHPATIERPLGWVLEHYGHLYRVNKGAAVDLRQVASLNGDQLLLRDGSTVRVSRRRLKETTWALRDTEVLIAEDNDVTNQ